ncbi:MAG: DUF6171 family protein [[Eubacterium] siraeum]
MSAEPYECRGVSEYQREYRAYSRREKADEALYKKRLEICTECDCLINGMCSKCGCFVEMRAAYAINRCPHEDKLW